MINYNYYKGLTVLLLGEAVVIHNLARIFSLNLLVDHNFGLMCYPMLSRI